MEATLTSSSADAAFRHPRLYDEEKGTFLKGPNARIFSENKWWRGTILVARNRPTKRPTFRPT
jgi:hypothetical protein